MMSTNTHSPIGLAKSILLYIVVALFLFVEMGIQVSPSVMTSQLTNELHLNAFGLGLMSGFYFYTYTFMQIPSGLLFDRFQPRYIISVSLLTCALGCLLFGVANNIFIGALGRLLTGMGSAFAFVAVLVVTADLFPNRYFAFITGITQMLAAFGAMSGQLPLNYIVNHLGWRQTMFLLAAIAAALSFIVWLSLNYKKQIVQKLSESCCKSTFTELRAIIRNPQSWLIALYACLLWAPMSGFASLWGVPFLMHVFKITHERAAFICSTMWLGLALSSPFLGWISTHFKSRVWPLSISALIGSLAFIILLIFPKLSSVELIVLLLLAGAACSGQALSFTVVKEINPEHRRATAIAFNNMAVVISGAIFQPFIGKLLDFHCKFGSTAQLSSCEALHHRLSMIPIVAAFVLSFVIATFFIKESWQIR